MAEICVKIEWGYPLYDAVGAKLTEERLPAPATVRELIDLQAAKYPGIESMLEKNPKGNVVALVVRNTQGLADETLLDSDCTLSIIVPLSGG